MTVDGVPLTVRMSLVSVREASLEATCQFAGHRSVAAVQVDWRDLAAADSPVVPGGVAMHGDCRPHVLEPLRLHVFDDEIVLALAFRGRSIADEGEYPYVMVLPRRGTE